MSARAQSADDTIDADDAVQCLLTDACAFRVATH